MDYNNVRVTNKVYINVGRSQSLGARDGKCGELASLTYRYLAIALQ